MKILNTLLAFLVIFMVVMPAMASSGDGEDNVKIIGVDGEEVTNGIGSQDTSKNTDESDSTEETDTNDDDLTDSDGFNKLLSAPIKGVDYLLGLGPTEQLVLLIVGTVIGGSIVLTIISLAVNNGRMGWGGIWGKWNTILQGRNWMAIVFLGFLGFLFALALMKYFATTSYF